MSEELKHLQDQVHPGITVFDFDGKDTPCITIDEKEYDEMLSKIAGQSISVNTDLNILQDGLGNVFVEIVLTFSKGNILKKFLVDAKTDLSFFESLAQTSMLGLSSPSAGEIILLIGFNKISIIDSFGSSAIFIHINFVVFIKSFPIFFCLIKS